MCDAEVQMPTMTIRERGREEAFIFLATSASSFFVRKRDRKSLPVTSSQNLNTNHNEEFGELSGYFELEHWRTVASLPEG